jgi:predicted metal-binding protein
MKVTLCHGCAPGQPALAARLAEALHEAGVAASVATVDCMSGCARPSTAAFRASGKTAYLFCNLVDGDLAGLVVFARAYARSPDGDFADARFLGDLRTKVLARIPG